MLPGIRARSLNGCSGFRARQGSQDLICGRSCKLRASELCVTYTCILFRLHSSEKLGDFYMYAEISEFFFLSMKI